eukprot:scaffold9354_cov50-Attheya_sp.AAC.4
MPVINDAVSTAIMDSVTPVLRDEAAPPLLLLIRPAMLPVAHYSAVLPRELPPLATCMTALGPLDISRGVRNVHWLRIVNQALPAYQSECRKSPMKRAIVSRAISDWIELGGRFAKRDCGQFRVICDPSERFCIARIYFSNQASYSFPKNEKNRENPSRKSGRVRVPSQKVLAGTLSSKNGSDDHDGLHDSEEVSSQNTSSNKQVTASSVAWRYQLKAKIPDVITVFKHVMWPRLQALGWKEKTEDGVTYYILPGVEMTKQYCLYNRHYFDQVPNILQCVKKQWSKNEQAILSMQLYEACEQELKNMEKSGTLSEQVNFDLLIKKVQKSRRK